MASLRQRFELRRLLLAGVLLFSPWLAMAGAPTRPPTRPSPTPPPTRASNPSSQMLDVSRLARRFGLREDWSVPNQRMVLRAEGIRLVVEADSRELDFNGYRVFLGQPARLIKGALHVSEIDAEGLLGALLRPGYAQSTIPDSKVIVIDPGHGGPDQGTENRALGLKEKVLALDVAERLKRALETAGYKVILTRTDDRQLLPDKRADLQERAEIANRAKADLFVSLHFNSVPNDTRTKGVEVYAYSPQFQRSTDSWSRAGTDDSELEAARINAFDHWNFMAAHFLHRRLLGQLRSEDRGQKMAHWLVLRHLRCPGILVEAGFLSNEAEARKIGTAEYRQKIAEAMAAGIKDYTAKLNALRGK